MTNEQLEDFSALWANGVNVGKIWNKIKARFVSGYHDQTSYDNSWRMQARTNLGIGTPAQNYMWIGDANNAVTTIETSALGRSLLSTTISANAMWYGKSANTLEEVTTSPFGRGLLSAQSGSVISGLYAERASRLTNTSAVGNTSLPVYFTSGGVPAIINALSVPGNIQSTGGGVSAVGLADLAAIGGGGGSNASEIYIGTTRYPFNENGQAYLPAYPSDFYTQAAADNKFATITQINTINAKIPSAATSSNQLADKAFVNSSINTATASYKGNYNVVSDLSLAYNASTSAIATALNGKTMSPAPNKNDYCFVTRPTSTATPTQIKEVLRYKYDDDNSTWSYEYTINNSGFTAEQWSAINSGATPTKISDILPKSTGTTKGDLITFSAANDPQRLGIGSTGQFLKVVSDAPAWASFAQPTVAWTGGTTAGPTLTVTTDGGSSDPKAIPSATASASGVVTTGAQTFAGAKTFNGGIVLPNAVAISSYNTSQTAAKILQLTSTNNLHLGETTSGLHNTYINGNNVYVRLWNGTSWNSAITIESNEIGFYIGTKKEASLTAYGFSALDGGVSANGLVDLAVIGGGGGGSASSIQFGSALAIPADENGLMKVPTSIASSTTNAVSLSIGGSTLNITPSTLRTSLGLGTVYSHGYGEFVTTLGVSGNTLTWSKGGSTQNALPIQGVVTAKGSQTQPVYVSADGTFSVTKTYAGGTSVTLNGESKSAAVATLYAPTVAGTAGQWLKSSGSGAPVWESPANMLAGMATKLETEAKPNQEFTYRNSPKTIGADSLVINKFKGKTLTWNQNHKMSTAIFATWSGSGAQASSSKTGNSVTLTVTSAGIYSFYTSSGSGFIPDGHKVYAAASIKPSVEIQQASIRIGRGNNYAQPTVTLSANVFNRISFIQAINNGSVATDLFSYFVFERGGTQQQLAVGTTIEITDLIIVDLTRMFGAGNEPSTTADFEKMFPLGYYPYNTGEIINNDADGLETMDDNDEVVGYLPLHLDNIQVKSPNIWDEEYLVGVYDQSDGETFSPNVGYLCSANKIPIVDGGSYYFKSPYNIRLYFYDHNKKYLYTTTMNHDVVYQFPDGVCYIRIQMAYSGTYANDICINANGVNNGKYFPSGILTINGINSTPNGTCDEISGNKLIKRTGRKKLKDLSWSLLSSNRYVAVIYGSKHPYFSFFDSSKYTFTSSPYSGDPDMTIWSENLIAQPNDGVLRIRDSEIGSSTALQNSFTDEEIIYELGQYEEYELVSPIPDTMPAGTTERIISDRLPVTPFACDITYGTNPGDILASGIAWEKIWGRATLNKGVLSDALVSNVANNGEWFEFNVGGVKMYLSFAVADGAFRLAISDDKNNPTINKEFTFATLTDGDIDLICD